MFSSFVSLLPSIHLPGTNNNNGGLVSPSASKCVPTDTPEEEEAYKQQSPEPEELGVKKSKQKGVHESFIIVRPPPAKSNHPLNLQLQLVPPATRGRQSVDDSDGASSSTTYTSLKRTASNRSDTSSYGSTASIASNTSASSTRRTIIPLYSLQAHNVMTNTIVDAGTDAKIAKFLKRGMELIDLAMLEPVEVWGERPGERPKANPAIRTSRPATPDLHLTTAESSVVSLQRTSSVISNYQPTPTMTPMPNTSSPSTGLSGTGSSSKKNLFGKMFKKKDSSLKSPPPSPGPSRTSTRVSPSVSPLQLVKSLAPDSTPTTRSRGGHARNLSATLSPSAITDKLRHRSSSPNTRALGLGLLQVPSLEETPSETINRSSTFIDPGTPVASTPTATNDEGKILRPPILGIQPTLSYSFNPNGSTAAPDSMPIGSLSKSARALMYVWFVKRWFKRRGDDPETRDKLRKRASIASHHSLSTNLSSDDGAQRDRSVTRSSFGENRQQNDDDEDSEPEDSETPWTCTLKIRRLGTASPVARSRRPSSAVRVNGAEQNELGVVAERQSSQYHPPQVLRMKVGTLSPTPHHPKVLGMLKVPFPLPDIEVERMEKVPRSAAKYAKQPVTDLTDTTRQHPKFDGLTLTAEDIKDVVCCTAMWLTVREGFGGVGKVNRKGDGWRIRA
ncbi:hypothetical protein H0H93_014801 [Arthromyces matolae]|nr:hypothetical protein H0H93_014801 [Arthromyces matolae]